MQSLADREDVPQSYSGTAVRLRDRTPRLAVGWGQISKVVRGSCCARPGGLVRVAGLDRCALWLAELGDKRGGSPDMENPAGVRELMRGTLVVHLQQLREAPGKHFSGKAGAERPRSHGGLPASPARQEEMPPARSCATQRLGKDSGPRCRKAAERAQETLEGRVEGLQEPAQEGKGG